MPMIAAMDEQANTYGCRHCWLHHAKTTLNLPPIKRSAFASYSEHKAALVAREKKLAHLTAKVIADTTFQGETGAYEHAGRTGHNTWLVTTPEGHTLHRRLPPLFHAPPTTHKRIRVDGEWIVVPMDDPRQHEPLETAQTSQLLSADAEEGITQR